MSIFESKQVPVKPTVLLADDHEEILQFLAEDLAEHFRILTAKDGSEVLELIKVETVSLIVSDIMMPHVDGYELCKAIKSNIEYSHIPLVLLTAKNTLESKIKGLEYGADAYIEKPFSPEHLLAQITSLLSNRNKIRQYFAQSPLIHINTMAHSRSDELFLERLHTIIMENMADPNLDVERLAEKLNISRPTLYRKIKAISDLSPNDLINITRLKKAATMLLERNHKIFEISYLVGYSSQTHFGRNFQKQFGMSPSEYVAINKNQIPEE